MVRDARWSLVGLENFSQPISVAIPLGNIAARFGNDFDGIIGGEFISEFVVEIDYEARLLKLHDKSKFKYTGAGEIIPIQINENGHLTLEAEVTPIDSKPIRQVVSIWFRWLPGASFFCNEHNCLLEKTSRHRHGRLAGNPLEGWEGPN